MTMKLTTSKLPMELDLDSFLNLHSDSDDDSTAVPHRTLDEILDDSDSSTSTSPPSSPSSLKINQSRLSDLPLSLNDAVSDDSTGSLKRTQSQLLGDNSDQTRPNSFTRVKSGGLSADSVWRASSSSRPLPSLFGGVRSNAKPGAALAAAAAASRSVPTPHAAAIKSRRAVSLRKVMDTGKSSSLVGDDHEIVSNSSTGDSVVAATERNRSDGKLAAEDDNAGDYQSALEDEISARDRNLETTTEVFPSKDLAGEVEAADKMEELRETSYEQDATTSISNSTVYLHLDDGSKNLGSDDRKDETIATVSSDEDSKFVDVNDSCEVDILSSSRDDDHGKCELNSTMMPLEEGDYLEKDLQSSKDDEAGITTGGGDDASSISEISELVEERIEQLESERIIKRAQKKLRSTMKPLELAEELEKRQASTGLHWEEGAAAQPMKLEGVRRGSTTLGYFDIDASNAITRTIASQAFRRDHGSPQVLAVHLNYIAVGMAKGVIVVAPSRYSSYSTDNMDSKMLILGVQGDRSHAPVTSMCFNQLGDLLLAGYGDGHITVWDVQRASAAKVITGEHMAPVVHALFLGQDSQVTRQFKAVTGDSKGLVLLHAFSVVPLLNRFTIKTQCLLDGQRTGTVLSALPLLFDESVGGALPSSLGNASLSSSSIGNMMGGVVGGDAGWKLFNEGSSMAEEGVVIFVTHQTALVVRLTPTLEVYAQLSKPEGVREGSMPYTAWKCTTQSRSSSSENITADVAERVSLLAVAWDRKVQVAKLVKSELKVFGTWSLDSAAIGVAWLDAHMLVVLTLTGQLYLFAKDGTVIHQTSFAVDGSGGDDLVAYHTHFINIYGNPEKAYHNCVAVRGASIYIIGPIHLIVSRLLPWKERIQVLRRAGDWMGALNMAMTLYDGQAHGVIDLPRAVDAVQEMIMPYLVELLLSYVDEVFSYISVAFCNQIGKVEQDDQKSGSGSVRSEIKEQFTRVGGVAVEFCVHVQRTDILFDEIFSKFVAVQHRDTFLELLEPYILRDMLGSLPPEIMQALVEHYSSKGWLQRVEQCVLHMDISSLDFNQVVRLCREHGLYGALVYLFNKGLDDFRAPLEELLIVSRSSDRESAVALGYRMLVYLKYCFSGLAFPPGHGALPPTRLPSLRTELVQFLLENSSALNSRVVLGLSSRGTYLNLYHLLELDTEATLDVLRLAFMDDENPKPEFTSHDVANINMENEQENITTIESQNILVQNTLNALVQIIEKDASQAAEHASSDDTGSVEAWPSKRDIGNLFEFIAYHVACRKAYVSSSVLSQILEYLTSESNLSASIPAHVIKTLKRREKQVLALLEVVPETDWNSSYVLQLCEKAHYHQVCGFIHTIRNQYLAALDSYMKDVDEPVHTFAYINNTLRQLSGNERDDFQSAVMSRIPELVVLSREGTFLLVIDHFNSNNSHIFSQLHSHLKSLFLYLKTVIEVHLSGTLNFSHLKKDDVLDAFSGRRVKDQLKGLEAYLERISEFPKFIRNNPVHVADDMIELYMELLCQYERDSVLKFLETFDSYRVEHCLRLCQEYGITDAAAFLLERVGDVGSALFLTLSGLNDKFAVLDTAVGSVISTTTLRGSAGIDYYSTVLKMKEVDEIRSILNSCIGLCQRNTPRLQPEESETLWFRLLDSFCEPLMDSHADERVLRESQVGMPAETLGEHEDDEPIIKWKISRSHKGAHILRKLFSQFIKEIVEGMIGYVRLPTIMSKLLSDNGSQEFGDFKITILGMLGTYGFERRILDTAKSLIEDDTFYTMSLLKKGASHGYAPRSLICCICNCLLTKGSSSFQIQVFSCGHATHLQCELLESDSSSKGSLSGCPVCMPKKNTQRPRNKSILPENGSVNKVSSRSKRSQGTSLLHLHDDSLDSSQQISRFDILTNLQKDQKLVQIENIPQLRLAPPAVYHEKVKEGPELLTGESSSGAAKIEKPSKRRQLRELKVTGSSLRFPLKSSIFGKEKMNKR
ncbi:hypothetical protein P3X46_014929 [Hevea brasiliensis]|uniref:RING-type domain-containing protein n=1 Tax=Hevea brasiliensis TaxID=3981 RepID=A0ABQ9LYH6_HEVBR|nr:uncharacterized protein LOC110672712 [Hevea brasiliensis]KAJ9171579.1 hypothetical protein P3X46_014929 [Hevea brasiliensis]